VLPVTTLAIQGEGPLGVMAHQQRVTHLEVVERRGDSTFHYQLEEELHLSLVGAGANGVLPFHHLAILLNSQRYVLAGLKGKGMLGANAYGPQIFGMILAVDNFRFLESFGGSRHAI
jgi:hypothetical protein